ncbi:MAG: asparagine synthase C-terminal domain-containing protein [Candidatus Moranbacteria bacterium]|jgi:asparagine synthetase B (glutamine-hydrolysing)|nr:asparagine synthase C-terminal domain-containing protein [Candidatus Moranbacteria bacterium]
MGDTMRDFADWRNVIELPIVAKKTRTWSLAELEEILTEYILLCSIRCFILNNEVICTTLSGGIDSSFCLAKIRKAVGKNIPIHTFTIGVDEAYPDIQFARMVSEKFRTIHHEIIPQRGEINEAKKRMHVLLSGRPYFPGDIAVFLIYERIAREGFGCVIAHDGIDELLGGYWKHRECDRDNQKKKKVFQDFWSKLGAEHLLPLERISQYFGIKVLLPYLQIGVVEYISEIPLNERTTFKESKIPLRAIAKKYLPKEVIKRNKKGFCSALGGM